MLVGALGLGALGLGACTTIDASMNGICLECRVAPEHVTEPEAKLGQENALLAKAFQEVNDTRPGYKTHRVLLPLTC